MLHGHMSQQPIAQQMTFEHTGCPRSDGAATAGTIFLLEPVVNGLATERFHINDSSLSAAFVVKSAATIRADLCSGNQNHLVGVFCRDALPPVAVVTVAGSAGRTRSLAPDGIGFDGQFRRGC